MATENTTQAQNAANAPAKIADAIATTTEKVVKASATVAKRERAKTQRRNKRQATAAKTATRRATTAKRKYTRKAATAVNKTAAAAQETIKTMTNGNAFPSFDAIPAFAPFQSMFANVGDRGQDIAQRGQKVAEQFADITRSNVEAIVEAGRVAANGARTIGQDVVATGRDGVEQAADAIRSLAEAKSPTEYLQLQNNFARASFDRMVSETSKLTETMVKLAGEAFQPLSNRASANAERFNTFVA
ncbi:MAG: phasin family protein [Sphingomicrobium sp.]